MKYIGNHIDLRGRLVITLRHRVGGVLNRKYAETDYVECIRPWSGIWRNPKTGRRPDVAVEEFLNDHAWLLREEWEKPS